MSDLLQKYNDWPDNMQTLTGVERVIFRIADSIADHRDLCDEWAVMDDEAKAELLDNWKRIVTAEFIGTLKEAMKEHLLR